MLFVPFWQRILILLLCSSKCLVSKYLINFSKISKSLWIALHVVCFQENTCTQFCWRAPIWVGALCGARFDRAMRRISLPWKFSPSQYSLFVKIEWNNSHQARLKYFFPHCICQDPVISEMADQVLFLKKINTGSAGNNANTLQFCSRVWD